MLRHGFAVLAASLIIGTGALAQSPSPAPAVDASGPAHVVTYIETLPSAHGKVPGLLRALRAASLKEAGVVRFDVLQRRERPNHFAIIETWRDGKAQEAHAQSAAVKQMRDALAPLLSAPLDERPHGSLHLNPVGGVKVSREALYAVTHVDFIPTKKDEGLAAARMLGDQSAKDRGVLGYDVLQQTSRPNHITLVEVWRDMPALEAHESSKHIRAFRDTLLPMSGSLYDQRIYRAL